ncbi:MAG TPA: hypothetical protein VII33_19850, partial [Nakamurella sp.]
MQLPPEPSSSGASGRDAAGPDAAGTDAAVGYPAQSLSGPTARHKVVTAAEAVLLIRDGESVMVEGFAGQCFAEELTLALEQRFLTTGAPRDLTLVFTAAPGDKQGRGVDRLCH